MARIPLQTANRSLDTGSVVQYPSGSPIGAALENAGNALSAAAQRVKQKDDQKDDFDARIWETEFTAAQAGLEDQAVQTAPEDAAGLHDGVVGQIDPVTNRAIKPGSFDTLFDQYKAKMPASKQAEFEAKRDVYRLQSSNRLAGAQYQGEQAYYKVQIQKTQDGIINSILAGDPNDTATYDQFRQRGLEIIDKSGLPALAKDVAKTNWEANASETLFKLKMEKDPAFAANARGALGLAPIAAPTDAASGPAVTGNAAVDTVVNRIIGVESGGNANAKNPKSSAEGLGQFIDSTWMTMVKKYRPDVAEGKSRSQILALKFNGPLSREMTTRYTQENGEYLTNRGVATTPGNLYLAHFLGPGGAVRALKADPSSSVASVLGQDVVSANGFLSGKSIADLKAWSDKKMGGKGAAGAADPAFSAIPPDRRLVLANQADVAVGERQRIELANAKADYAGYKDSVQLQIVQGGIKDEGLISSDPRLDDGDKASLITAVRSQNEKYGQIQSDLSALGSKTLALDPYSSKDKTRADNLFSEVAGKLPPEKSMAIASEIIQQTGVVPQPVVNDLRRGLSSTSIQDVIAAAQSAQRISQFDPALLGRRDGGAEVQKAADDFGFYVNRLNLPPEVAARRMMDANSPDKKFARKALEPAAKEFVKLMGSVDLAGEFDSSGVFGADVSLGMTPGQELGIKADFIAIAEDQFYAANGDPDLAKNRAIEEMKRLYGTTEFGAGTTVVKHPPERYWPKQKSEGGPLGIGADPFSYAKTQLNQDLTEISPDYQPDSVQLVTTPETDAMVKRGEMPGYAVMWKDANGVLQTIPGKLWRPDPTKIQAIDQANQAAQDAKTMDRARSNQQEELLRAQIQSAPDGGRGASLDAFIGGANAPLKPEAMKPAAPQSPRQQLQDQVEGMGLLDPTPGNAM